VFFFFFLKDSVFLKRMVIEERQYGKSIAEFIGL